MPVTAHLLDHHLFVYKPTVDAILRVGSRLYLGTGTSDYRRRNLMVAALSGGAWTVAEGYFPDCPSPLTSGTSTVQAIAVSPAHRKLYLAPMLRNSTDAHHPLTIYGCRERRSRWAAQTTQIAARRSPPRRSGWSKG